MSNSLRLRGINLFLRFHQCIFGMHAETDALTKAPTKAIPAANPVHQAIADSNCHA